MSNNLQYTFLGKVISNNFTTSELENDITTSYRTVIDEFNNGDTKEYDDKIVKLVNKNETHTFNKYDFTEPEQYTTDVNTVVLDNVGKLDKNVPTLINDGKWIMDNSSENVIDSSGNNFDGIASNYKPGENNSYALSRQIVNYGTIWMTIGYKDFWLYISKYPINTPDMVMSKVNGFSFKINSEGNYVLDLYYDGNTMTLTGTEPIELNTWVLITVYLRDTANNPTVYKNGVEISKTTSGTIADLELSDGDFIIGNFPGRIKNFSDTSSIELMNYKYQKGKDFYGYADIRNNIVNLSFDQGSGTNLEGDFVIDDGADNVWSGESIHGDYCLNGNDENFLITGTPSILLDALYSLDLTVTFWLRLNNTNERSIAKQDTWKISTYEGKIKLTIYDNETDSLITDDKFNTDTWIFVHVLINKNLLNSKIYINGESVPVTYGSQDVLFIPTDNTITIGDTEKGMYYLDYFNMYRDANKTSDSIRDLYIMADEFPKSEYNTRNAIKFEDSYIAYSIERQMAQQQFSYSPISISNNSITEYIDNGLYMKNINFYIGKNRFKIERGGIFSLEFWIYLYDYDCIIMSNKYILLKITDHGQLRLEINTDENIVLEYLGVLEKNKWYHIVWNNDYDLTLYNNGFKAEKSVLNNTILNKYYSCIDDALVFGSGDYLLSYLIIHNTVLDENYITNRYNNGIRTGDLPVTFKQDNDIEFYFDDPNDLLFNDGTYKLLMGHIDTSNVSTDTGKIGSYCLKYNEVDRLVDTETNYEDIALLLINKLKYTKQFTVEFWYKTDYTGSDNPFNIISRESIDTKTHLLVDVTISTQSIAILFGNNTGTELTYTFTSLPIVVGTWYHIVLVYNGNNGNSGFGLYLNNVKYNGPTTSHNSTNNSIIWTKKSNVQLGDSYSFNGTGSNTDYKCIDGLVFNFDKYYTPEDVELRYNNGNGTKSQIYKPIVCQYNLTNDLVDHLGGYDDLLLYEKDTFNDFSLSYDNIDSKIEIEGAAIFDDPFSIEINFKTDNKGSLISNSENNNGFIVYIDGAIHFKLFDDTGGIYDIQTDETDFSNNTWRKLFVVWTGTSGIIYIDNTTPRAITTITNTIGTDTKVEELLLLGYKFNGSIGDTIIYNKEMSVTEIGWRLSDNFGEVYPTNVYGIIETTGMYTAIIENTENIIFTDTTDVKYLFNVGYNYKWNGDSWIIENNISNGNTSSTLNALTTENWKELFEIYITTKIFQIEIGLFTVDENVTPSTNSIVFEYNGYTICTPSEIQVDIVDNMSTIKSISGSTFNNLIVYSYKYL